MGYQFRRNFEEGVNIFTRVHLKTPAIQNLGRKQVVNMRNRSSTRAQCGSL